MTAVVLLPVIERTYDLVDLMSCVDTFAFGCPLSFSRSLLFFFSVPDVLSFLLMFLMFYPETWIGRSVNVCVDTYACVFCGWSAEAMLPWSRNILEGLSAGPFVKET